MITYVDTSTLLKLIVDEPGSDRAELIWQMADTLAAATVITVEARAALAAANRNARLTAAAHRRAKVTLAALIDGLYLVAVTAELIEQAADLAETESLRGYDGLHLAAAMSVDATVLTSADATLCDAAARRGLHVANPLLP